MVKKALADGSSSRSVNFYLFLTQPLVWCVLLSLAAMLLGGCSSAFWDEYNVNPVGGGFSS